MKQNYIINKNTMYLIRCQNHQKAQVYTRVIEKDKIFVILKPVDEITRCSIKYYEEDKAPAHKILEYLFGNKPMPLLVSSDYHLVFIKATLASRHNEEILISVQWIKMIRSVGDKTQIMFKNGTFKTVYQSMHVIQKQQLLGYTVLGVVGSAKRKGV